MLQYTLNIACFLKLISKNMPADGMRGNSFMKEVEEMNETKNSRTPNSGKKVTSKQVVAIIGIVLLVLMYVATLIAAIADSSASGRLFWMCLYATVVIPILIWVYTWVYGKLTRKHTFADFDLGGNAEEDQKKD